MGYVYDPGAVTTMQGREMVRDQRYLLALQRCFTRARKDLEAVGGVMADCTPGGFLTGHTDEVTLRRAVLPYVPLEEVLHG